MCGFYLKKKFFEIHEKKAIFSSPIRLFKKQILLKNAYNEVPIISYSMSRYSVAKKKQILPLKNMMKNRTWMFSLIFFILF